MNAKVCKILRGQARGKSVGMPERRLMAGMKTVHGHTVRIAVNHPQSTRGIYRAMKREVKRTKGTV